MPLHPSTHCFPPSHHQYPVFQFIFFVHQSLLTILFWTPHSFTKTKSAKMRFTLAVVAAISGFAVAAPAAPSPVGGLVPVGSIVPVGGLRTFHHHYTRHVKRNES